MTRYANVKRNAEIARLFLAGVPPKEIRFQLKLTSTALVYKVLERLHVKRFVQICPTPTVAKGHSTA